MAQHAEFADLLCGALKGRTTRPAHIGAHDVVGEAAARDIDLGCEHVLDGELKGAPLGPRALVADRASCLK